MSSAPIKPLTVSEFDVSNLSMGSSRENTERGFTKHYLNYNRGNLQDNKLIGAVTHVIVNTPEFGYGIFAENMIKELNYDLIK